MKVLRRSLLSVIIPVAAGLSYCDNTAPGNRVIIIRAPASPADIPRPDTIRSKPGAAVAKAYTPGSVIETGNTDPRALITFSRTLTGIPYKYASSDPAHGFDCSGFITYVFNHFGVSVPRSSVDFTDVGEEVPIRSARPGDLILFTGTDSLIKKVGHMGIITASSADSTVFIHSTSGKAYSVTETPLNTYYQGRFMKVIRIFN